MFRNLHMPFLQLYRKKNWKMGGFFFLLGFQIGTFHTCEGSLKNF